MASNRLTPAEQRAMAFWPQIEEAARSGMTTKALWANIDRAAEELGTGRTGLTVQGVSGLRSKAVGIQRREGEFSRLADIKRISGTNFVVAPFARTPGEMRASPMFSVRFEHTTSKNGELSTAWRTSVFEGKPPATAGELRRMVRLDAEQMAKKYGLEDGGIDSLQLLSI